jgi:protein-S-isoprenylcysteine O-methyltransferase Ste14
MASTQSSAAVSAEAGLAERLTVFVYSVVAYVAGMAAILWLVACAAGIYPLGAAPFTTGSAAGALVVDAVLIVLFGLQHSVMARQRFKNWWTRIVPPPAERSTFVLTAAAVLALVLWFWQPMDTVVWSVESPVGRVVLWSLFALGWLYLVASTYVTNHYDLFGLRQAWLHLRNRPYTPVPFVRSWMYRYSRHPMMAGILLGLWATPEMRADHLALAVGMSAYIAVGIAFEQRELAAHFGQKYRDYCREVGALLPRLRG